MVDRRGLPVRLVLTPRQASDKTAAPDLVTPLGLTGDVVVDRGYFGDRRQPAARALMTPPSTATATSSALRGVATRYNKLAQDLLAAVVVASSRVWHRRREPKS